jgi:hypothetical protein
VDNPLVVRQLEIRPLNQPLPLLNQPLMQPLLPLMQPLLPLMQPLLPLRTTLQTRPQNNYF